MEWSLAQLSSGVLSCRVSHSACDWWDTLAEDLEISLGPLAVNALLWP